MISMKLVHLMQEHADELADDLVVKLRCSPRTQGLQKIPAAELRRRICETLRDFHAWLLDSDRHSLQERHRDLGRHHAGHDVSLPDVCWAIVLIKEQVWHFVTERVFYTTPVEIHAELELIRLLDLFFDAMIFHVTEGYEQERGKRGLASGSSSDEMQALAGQSKGMRQAGYK